MIEIFVTHYSDETCPELEALTLETVRAIAKTTFTKHRVTVIGYTSTETLWHKLAAELIPLDVRPIRHVSKVGRPDRPPSIRNRVVNIVRGGTYSPFVLLHNDVQPAHGWLDRLVKDLRWAEDRWGFGSSIVTPRLVPYESSTMIGQIIGTRVLARPRMNAWCLKHRVERKEDGRLACPRWAPPSDDGHQLTQFIARPVFFDQVGPCDETFEGINYDDSDWGIRALLAGKHSLISTTGLVGHAEGTTAGVRGDGEKEIALNRARYVEKWGERGLEELHTGAVWRQLRDGG